MRSSGSDSVSAAVDEAFAAESQPTNATLVNKLSAAGLSVDVAEGYLSGRTSLRRWGDVWVRWEGSAVEKAHTILDLLGEPATAEAINEMIGEGYSIGTIQNGMSGDSRFVRTGKRTWGLRAWGVEEYSGIVNEILERIDRHGGAINVSDLIRGLLADFPDVSENSIRMYLGTMAFVVEGEDVRRRTDDDDWPIAGQFRDARGAFRNGDNEVRLSIPVTRELLRGSGQPIHPAVAAALGVKPGGRRIFTSHDGAASTVGWRPWSVNGPDIGSVRALATRTDAQPGDTLVLVFGIDGGTLDAARIAPDTDGIGRLTLMLGVDMGGDATASLAAGMDCRASEVRSVLRSRGDGELAACIPATTDARLESRDRQCHRRVG